MAYQLFVSHANADFGMAQQIFQRAHEADIRAYLYEHDHLPGITIGRKVLTEINSADAVVVLFTVAGAQSAYVNQEIGAALAFQKRVIALVEAAVAEQRLGMLNGVEYLPLEPNSEAVLHRLVTALQKAKEKKSNWLWGIGGAAVTLLLTSSGSEEKVQAEVEDVG
jgi:hypothetical protein